MHDGLLHYLFCFCTPHEKYEHIVLYSEFCTLKTVQKKRSHTNHNILSLCHMNRAETMQTFSSFSIFYLFYNIVN